jgi:transcriptional regulator with XRE-family HTH domain
MEIADISRRLALVGRTQAQLAAYLGVGKTHMSQMLSGKRRMALDTFRKIEAFLAAAEGGSPPRGLAEEHGPRFEGARLQSNTELSEEERDRLVRELVELGDAYKLLPTVTTLTDDELLGYDENGVPA